MSSSRANIPKWNIPEETKQTGLDWAPLNCLDLSQITGDDFTEVPDAVVEEFSHSFSKDGFIYAENHGLSHQQVLRQFDIGKFAFNVSESQKTRYKADILGKGSFVGYKNQGHWKIDGVGDRIEHLNLSNRSFDEEARKELFPQELEDLMPEIIAFASYNHNVIFRKLLTVLSRVLKLPADYLWNLSKDLGVKDSDILRYAMYHTPDKADDKALGGVRLQGHTDFNCLTILWSQPITSLEILMPDNVWRLVKHRSNALVINAGDALHFLSGGYFKATIHRVVAPPEDQAHYTRLGVFYFAPFKDDLSLQPLESESPIVREAYKGKNFWKRQEEVGEAVPTASEWKRMRVKAYGQGGTKKREDGHEEEEILGVKITQYNSVGKGNGQK